MPVRVSYGWCHGFTAPIKCTILILSRNLNEQYITYYMYPQNSSVNIAYITKRQGDLKCTILILSRNLNEKYSTYYMYPQNSSKNVAYITKRLE